MTRTSKITVFATALLMATTFLAAGCKTGKGCDCPTFGKNETPKVTRF